MCIDYAVVVVGANMGVVGMTREHLGILLYLEIPFIIVITKTDICPPEIYKKTIKTIKSILKNQQINKLPIVLKQEKDKNKTLKNIKQYTNLMNTTDRVVPIISVSNKTGKNLDLVNAFLYNLKPRQLWEKKNINGTIITINTQYQVPGVGLVLSGLIKGDNITVGQNMFLGPYNGKFIPIRIRSMHSNIREDIKEGTNGHDVCIAIKFTSKISLNKYQIKKGMVVVSDQSYSKNICTEFEALVKILHHATTIQTNYQPIIHCNSVRQTAKITINNKKVLRTGGKGNVNFKFVSRPEFIQEGSTLFFRDGRTKGIGCVTKIYPLKNK